ncbi:MAG: universal stress protein [Chitinophagaceae bacterium]
MKHILVPTDFSTCANNAVDFAVQSAKIIPAEIIILYVFEMKGNVYTDYMGVNMEFNQSLLEEAFNKLALLKKSIEETEGVVVKTEILKGSINESIQEAAQDHHIDLIVMGTLGASGLKEKIWGSKTAKVIGNSKVPVMVIPLEYTWKKPAKFLMVTNHFEKEPVILDFLFELADLYMAQVQVAVFTEEDEDNALTLLEHTRKAPQYEKMLREQYKEETLTASQLFGKDFEETLQDYIRQNQIDLLAMVTYQKKFPDSIFHRSMTKRMSYHTTIPLLAIPGKQD